MKFQKTFGDILNQHGGIGPGFDLLRLGLAIAIFLAHAAHLANTRGPIPSLIDLILGFVGYAHAADVTKAMQETLAAGTPWLRPIVLTHVPMFFALSGFLVTGSAFRTKRTIPFLSLRLLRIFPALCVEVALSALIIGAVFTSLPLSDYYRHPEFFTYFGNIIGNVQMQLPGVVFWRPSENAVNANLWTLPGEFYCYLILAAMIATGVAFNRAISTAAFIVATVALIVANVFFGFDDEQWLLASNINVYYFFVGCMFFHWRDAIPHHWMLAAACIPIVYVLAFFPSAIFVAPAFLAYITVFIGCTAFRESKLVKSGDYSYGIYLYGYPIMQAVVGLVPYARGKYFTFVGISLSLTLLFAVFSWHCIEKHCLKLRRFFSKKSAQITEQLHPGVASDERRSVA